MKNAKWSYRLLLIAIASLVALSWAPWAYAQTVLQAQDAWTLTTEDVEHSMERDLPGLLGTIRRSADDFGFDKEALSEVHLLSPVSIITPETSFDADGKIEERGILHFPVVDQSGKIFAIYTVIKTDGSVNANFGEDFAPLLEKLKSSNDDIVLVRDYSGLAAINLTSNQAIPLREQLFSVSSELQANLQKVSPDYHLQLDETSQINQYYRDMADRALKASKNRKTQGNHDVNFGLDVDCNSESSKISDEEGIVTTTQVTESLSKDQQDSPISYRYPTQKMLRYSSSLKLPYYPIVGQYVDGVQRALCWAATTASICRYEKPNYCGNLTAQNVADYCGVGYDQGGSNTKVIQALNHYLGSPYSPQSTGVLSPYDIQVVINNNDPAYMHCRRRRGFWPWPFDAHAVAMYGYDFDDGYQIDIMDPAYERYKVATRSSEGDWTFEFDGTRFTWYNTVRLFYAAE